jgi:hypothetical protein
LHAELQCCTTITQLVNSYYQHKLCSEVSLVSLHAEPPQNLVLLVNTMYEKKTLTLFISGSKPLARLSLCIISLYLIKNKASPVDDSSLGTPKLSLIIADDVEPYSMVSMAKKPRSSCGWKKDPQSNFRVVRQAHRFAHHMTLNIVLLILLDCAAWPRVESSKPDSSNSRDSQCCEIWHIRTPLIPGNACRYTLHVELCISS